MAKPLVIATRLPLDIIDETVAFYSADPKNRRAVNPNLGCVYLSATGAKCAVGRCLDTSVEVPDVDEEHADAADEFNFGPGTLIADCQGAIGMLANDFNINQEWERDTDAMPWLPGYEGHGLYLWWSLQKMHDYSWNWEPSGGLTRHGKMFVERLRRRYGAKPTISDEEFNGYWEFHNEEANLVPGGVKKEEQDLEAHS